MIGVLATAGTLRGSKYLDTKGKWGGGVRIVEQVGKGFVELVEEGLLDGPEVESTVRASVQPLLDEGADIIVLGCTHYPFLRPVIQRIAGDSVRIIDPAPAVAKRTADVLLERGLIGKENVRNLEAVPDTVDSSFYSSGLPDSMGRILRYL